jgi:PAS domain S-box-containing protein
MFKNIKIGTKVTAVVITIVVITVAIVSFLAYNLSKTSVESRQSDNLNVLIDNRVDKISAYLTHINKNAQLITGSELTKSTLATDGQEADSLLGFLMSSSSESDLKTYLLDVNNAFEYDEILITDISGDIKYATDIAKEGSQFIEPNEGFFTLCTTAQHFSSAIKVDNEGHHIMNGSPIMDDFGNNIGLLFIKFKLESLFPVLQDSTGLGKRGELMLGSKNIAGNQIVYLNPFRNRDTPLPPDAWQPEDGDISPMQAAIMGDNGKGFDTDYRKKEVLAAWRNVPEVNWGIEAKIDLDEIYVESNDLLMKFFLSGLLIALISSFISILFSRYLVAPIHSLKDTLDFVGKGALPDQVEMKSKDEVGLMANSVNELVKALKRTASFATKIGEGDFDAKFEPLGESDTLGMSLIAMRDNLIEADKRDTQRNWIVSGVAEIGEILRMHDNLEALGDDVIKFIISKISAIQGAFYVVEEDEEKDFYEIQMKSSYAYNRKKHLDTKFAFAQGLVGQAAAEQDTVMRTEIPEEYVSISSGILGDQKPTCILIVPLITNEKVYGVLEFAGFEKFDENHVKFVEELSLILARTVFNIKINERTRMLLEESQTMSNELQEKQEVLRQNAEEMQATQEELTRSNSRLEEQIEEVNKTQNRMQLLLENASEVITIYEEDETIRYISPSVEPILGYSQDEMIGIKDRQYVLEDHSEIVGDMFKQLIDNPYQQVTVQYEYRNKDNSSVWLESTGTNFMSNPAIHGIIVNSTDITERRRAEQEQRMRSKMQALSENSLDLITRLEKDGPISYVNPIIESFTGNSPAEYLNKNLTDTDIDKTIVDEWLQILADVGQTNEKLSKEMNFPTEEGKRIMQVNAIPEFDEGENLESVLVVSHDITERKVIELEIQNKNKKINDSINYAKRIQNAILPDNAIINRTLADSFILYKPKDVVSGDFPWYVKVGDDIYIAAVDCTGHGVPGALLSLIGYFLLNDIVRSRKVSDPGLILDQLDEGVTTTLRQDEEDSKTKDGMDIALCKINTANRTVEYAGAHRSLYVMRKGEMQEIKGNKFAIGGGIYKNQTNFTNTKLKLGKGDSFFFCSDGFPDQFGGPDNRKFGPKRLREIITQIHDKSMQEAYQRFDNEWEGWKADEKQTDDVLLIGIKF